jgi:hypothetical protein
MRKNTWAEGTRSVVDDLVAAQCPVSAQRDVVFAARPAAVPLGGRADLGEVDLGGGQKRSPTVVNPNRSPRRPVLLLDTAHAQQ